ncbi:MAG TPA: GreA/GreB family elongation factor [Pseudonocardia sp.]|jgi:transcription elongation GreA/GreB family factor|nr:GreA/GreB family elongation factor [Pseudonocardia sp.]
MSNPLGDVAHLSDLPESVQRQLREELEALRAQRQQLRGDSVAEDHRASDSGDRAEALRRADDVFRVEDRITEIHRLLTAGSPGRAVAGRPPALAEGSIVTLRFPDGDEETFYASSILDAAPEEIQAEVLGLSSPLAKALTGHTTGDTITWSTPTGSQQADVVTIRLPSPRPPTG